MTGKLNMVGIAGHSTTLSQIGMYSPSPSIDRLDAGFSVHVLLLAGAQGVPAVLSGSCLRQTGEEIGLVFSPLDCCLDAVPCGMTTSI
jgi:hypothetical protein